MRPEVFAKSQRDLGSGLPAFGSRSVVTKVDSPSCCHRIRIGSGFCLWNKPIKTLHRVHSIVASLIRLLVVIPAVSIADSSR